VIKSVYNDINTLSRILNQLLLLTQTDTDMARKNFSLIRIDDCIWFARNDLIKRYKEYQITVIFDGEPDDKMLTILGDMTLLKTAFII